MKEFAERFSVPCAPYAHASHVITRGSVRITVLTSRLVRVETQSRGHFTDEATQSVWFRAFEKPAFRLNEGGGSLQIRTDKCCFEYSLKQKKMLQIRLDDCRTVSNYTAGNLKGTCRTLDSFTGPAVLGNGVVSKNGVAVLDDSDSLLIKDDGTVAPRPHRESDEYYFAYGYDYLSATRDFYRLTGNVPLIPRFALGNWWSRYKAYSAKEYLALMDRFDAERVPLSVATVDMDWHWVDVKAKFGAEHFRGGVDLRSAWNTIYNVGMPGWTGYSFNTDLFPDPDAFLADLKRRGLRVTFNLHPAQGVRFFEDQYKEFAQAMGVDPKTGRTIPFDITSPKFVLNYFDILHHPYEEKGVDFWWIDWQQGKNSRIPGLDPLWALNHYHPLDNARGGRRALILSRFGGPGSQRYPLGFSGDTTQNWRSLEFQPYFTVNAANIGYPWWSHDIGGHHNGARDDELYLRWVEFGVFNPILRLHSTNNEFMGKEPWNYSGPVCRIAEDYLRLRHRLLPYLYTMNRRTAAEGRALCEPVYYTYPREEGAYTCKNEYFFGSELLVAPITEHTSPDTNLAGTAVWLPEGRWTDVFTGRIYSGQRVVRLFRDLESIPVLAKAGAIVPLAKHAGGNGVALPEEMEILIYRGNNTFTLYEDDGETLAYRDGAFAETDYTVTEDGSTVTFTVKPVRGDVSVMPAKRTYTLAFRDIAAADVRVTVNGEERAYETAGGRTLTLTVADVLPTDEVTVTLTTVTALANRPKREELIETIAKFQMNNDVKGRLFKEFVNNDTPVPPCAESMSGPLEEILALYRG